MNLKTVLGRPPRADVTVDELRAARRRAAEKNPLWNQINPPVRRGRFFLVDANDDSVYTAHPGAIWASGSASIVADMTTLSYYITPDGDLAFVEKRPEKWAQIFERQERRARAAG